MTKLEATVADILKHADIQINGKRPHDITIHDKRFYERVLKDRELGLGEAYMDGWWSTPRLDETITKLITADLASKVKLTPSMVATAPCTKPVSTGSTPMGAVPTRLSRAATSALPA